MAAVGLALVSRETIIERSNWCLVPMRILTEQDDDVVVIVEAEWLLGLALLPIEVIFGGAVDPPRAVLRHVALQSHRVPMEPIMGSCNEEHNSRNCWSVFARGRA